MSGARLALTGALNASVTAKMTRTSSAVPMTWSISGPTDRREVRRGEGGEDRERRDRVGRAAGDLVGGVDGGDREVVVEVDERGAHERAEHLRGPVGRDLAPREAAAQRLGERDRRVEVRAGDSAGHPHRQGDADAPARGDQQPVAAGRERQLAAVGLVQRRDRHGDRAAAEQDDDRGAERLGHQLAGRSLPPALRLPVRRHSRLPLSLGPAPAGYRPGRHAHSLARTQNWRAWIQPARSRARADARGDLRRRRHRRRGDRRRAARSTPRRAGCRWRWSRRATSPRAPRRARAS